MASETTAPPVTIVEFLTARLDEDEAVAHAAPAGLWSSVLETGDDKQDFGSIYFGGPSWDDAQTVADWYIPGAGDHIARNCPTRIPADIAAKAIQ